MGHSMTTDGPTTVGLEPGIKGGVIHRKCHSDRKISRGMKLDM